MSNTALFELQPQFPQAEKLASLLAKCSDDDEGGLAELYHLTAANLFALQVRILGMNYMAERALHDTYTLIWLRSSEYSEELGEPMPWLTSIARSHALNLKRARRAGKHNATETDQDRDQTSEIGSTSEYADTTFLSHHASTQPLKQSLEQLDINTRDAIVRAYLDGWSIEQLSEAYNKPIASLKSAIHAGMLSLRGQD